MENLTKQRSCSLEVARFSSEAFSAHRRLDSDSKPSDAQAGDATDSGFDALLDQGLDDVGFLDIENEQAATEKQPSALRDAFYGLPVWLVSLVFHLAFLLLLAFITLATSSAGDLGLIAEIDAVATDLELLDTEVIIDQPVVLEQVEMPQPKQESRLAEEPFRLPQEMLAPESFLEAFDVDGNDAELNQLISDSEFLDSGGAKAATANINGTSATFYGTESQGSRFVFVIDCSGSMAEELRWYEATRELFEAVDRLRDNQDFLVLLYNQEMAVMFGDRPENSQLVPATQENKFKLRDWILLHSPVGGTFPAQSVQLALSHRPDAVFFLSDGELNDNTVNLLNTWNPDLGENASDSQKQIPINTVSLGRSPGRRNMRRIARENSGVFVWVP